MSTMQPESEVSIKTLRAAIPDHCFQPTLLESFSYLLRDVIYSAILVHLALHIELIPSPLLRVTAWALYGFIQGCVGMGLWVLAHECGHGAFSSYSKLNDTVGWIVHSVLLVPYFSWKITHARHHRYAGHMEKDTAFVPYVKAEWAARLKVDVDRLHELTEDTPVMTALHLIGHQIVGWPFYLLAYVTAGSNSLPDEKEKQPLMSHFGLWNSIYTPSQKVYVFLSDVGILLVAAGLYMIGSRVGVSQVMLLYVMPYLWVNHWVVAITYLHHTHPSISHYGPQSWSFTRGALATVDRSTGFLGRHLFHEIIDYHVVHHLFSKIPFYRAEEATKAIRPLLGDMYKEKKDGNFHLDLFETYRTCTYVSPQKSNEGADVFEWS